MAKWQIRAYFDGSVIGGIEVGNKQVWGGWGVYLVFAYGTEIHHTKKLCGGVANDESEHRLTPHRMELMAAVEMLKALKLDMIRREGYQVIARGDNKPIITLIRQPTSSIHREYAAGWPTRNYRNRDLYQQLIEMNKAFEGYLSWHWIRGHAGNEGNREADRLARLGAKRTRDKALNVQRSTGTIQKLRKKSDKRTKR